MKGRLRITLSRPKSAQQHALAKAVELLASTRAKAFFGDGYDEDCLTATIFNNQISRIYYSIKNPDASLRWIDGEGFRLFGDNGDEEVLFELGREARS